MITGGICFSYWLDFGFSFLDPDTIAWRFPIGFQIFFAVLILLFVLELPESPRWLILKGKEDEAMSVLSALSDRPADDVRSQVTRERLVADLFPAIRLWRIYRDQRHSARNATGRFPRSLHHGPRSTSP